MRPGKLKLAAMLSLVWIMAGVPAAQAGDLDDGISKFTDESVSSEDSIKDKDVNINFIVVDALGKAKMSQKEEDEQGNAEGNGETQQTKNGSMINYNDGESETNENSIIVEPGSKVDKVINIVVEK